MADIRPRIVAEIPRLRRYARALTHNMTAADAVPMMEALIKKE